MPSVTPATVTTWSTSRSSSQLPTSSSVAAADIEQQPTEPEQQQQKEAPTVSALLVFLRFLLQKNRGALRDIPPPGLSDATVLMSAFFALLRLLQPALKTAHQGRGPLAAFPAAHILASSSPPAEAEVVHELPR
jgi:hypothetical protein